MPEKIKLVHIHAHKHEHQKSHVQQLFSERECPAHNIEYQEYHHYHTAVKIRQSFSVCQLRIRQQLVQNIKGVTVKTPVFRHFCRYIVSILHADAGRYQHYCRHQYPQQRESYSLSCSDHTFPDAAAFYFNKIQNRIIEQYEYAYHYSDIII